jgi:hypothetical protein
MEIGTVRQVDVGHEMQEAYLDYAMSVIVSRCWASITPTGTRLSMTPWLAWYIRYLRPTGPARGNTWPI